MPTTTRRCQILNDLSYDEDYAPTDDVKDTITCAIYAAFEEKYGEDFADCADNFIQDNDDIAGRVNPCAMSVETVRAVYGMGLMVTPRKRMPRKRTIEMRSRLWTPTTVRNVHGNG